MARILIAGCGDVGSALGRLLVGDGHHVWGLRRNTDALPTEIKPLAADLADPATLAQLPVGINVLYYTAAAAGFSDDAYRQTYVTGLYNILQELDRNELQRVIFISSTAVYGQDRGEWVDESSQTLPVGFSGKRMLEAEALLQQSNSTGIVLRLAGIYGPGRQRLLNQVRNGAQCIESPPQWTNRIHRDDCAGVLAHLLTLVKPHPVYIGVDDQPAPRCEVMDWLAGQLQVSAPARTTATVSMRGQNKRCSNRLLRASGYRCKYATYRQGYGEMLAQQKSLAS